MAFLSNPIGRHAGHSLRLRMKRQASPCAAAIPLESSTRAGKQPLRANDQVNRLVADLGYAIQISLFMAENHFIRGCVSINRQHK